MKLLVFAHVPPPHHGQSVMVQQMLDQLAARGIECVHIDARVSDSLEEVGGASPTKLFRLVRHCFQAVRARLRDGVSVWYYVPAPAQKSAVVRDLIVMVLVKPWFRKTIFHWHAYGLGHWACNREEHPFGENGPPRPPTQLFGSLDGAFRALMRFVLRGADLSIALTDYNAGDALLLAPRQVAVVANGIPDPCPDFPAVLAGRRGRLASRETFRVLFLAHCTPEKGLFRALATVRAANARLRASGRSLHLTLTVAGTFPDPDIEPAFRRECDVINAECGAETVVHRGFLSGLEKQSALSGHDALLALTTYPHETFGLNLLEAMACGLPAVVSRFRGLPEILPDKWPHIVAPDEEDAAARALLALVEFEDFPTLRERFLSRFEVARFGENLSAALRRMDPAP